MASPSKAAAPEPFPSATRGGINKTTIQTMKSTLAVLALAALIIPAQAEEKKAPRKGGDPAKMLKKKDTDGNGTLSLEEFIKGAPDADKATKAFKRKDKDGNGELTLDELKSGPPAKGEGKGKGKKKKDAE